MVILDSCLARQLDASRELLEGLGPVLRGHGCRIDLETHGDATTWELVRLAEAVGADRAEEGNRVAEASGLIGEDGGGAAGEGSRKVVRHVEGCADALAHDLGQNFAGHNDVGHWTSPGLTTVSQPSRREADATFLPLFENRRGHWDNT